MRRQRVLVVLGVLLCGLLFLEWRLFKLQIIEGEVWARESRRSTMTFESLPFERGWILDRNGEPLARTEEARDVEFRFRDYRHWKHGAVTGQLGALLCLLDGERRPLASLHDDLGAFLADLGRVSVADIARVQPRQRQTDVRVCVKGLLGATVADGLAVALSAPVADNRLALADLPGWSSGLADVRTRAREESAALVDVSDAAGLGLRTLLTALDTLVAASDARVAAALGRGPTTQDPFARLRSLRAEEESVVVPLVAQVSYGCATLVAIRGAQLPGFTVATEQRRVYPPGVADVATLLVGRLGAPGERDVGVSSADRARLTDLASLEDPSEVELQEYETLRIRVREIDYSHEDERGVLGLESALESVLRGKRGWIATTPLAEGEDGGRVESVPPQRGLNVTLTLDVEMQRACESALDHFQAGMQGQDPFGAPAAWPGAIVLLDPQTGAVLALASSPRPTREQLTQQFGALLEDTDKLGLLRNRALDPGASGNLAPPGSTFKPIAALAALAVGAVTPERSFECRRTLLVSGTLLGCTGLHDQIDLRHALAQSCNIYFFQLAERVGGDVLRDVARRFGLDRPTGLLQGNEVLAGCGIPITAGVHESAVPIRDGRLSRLETARLAIGQAALDDVTPLQIAVALGAIGTGSLRPPMLVAAVEGYGALPPRAAQPLGFDAASLQAVRDGLAMAVESSLGTARDLRLPADLAGLTLAAKTGTPQVQDREDHSWIAGYMPRERPRLAFAILLEHTGRHGGDACVPVLGELLARGAVHDYLLREATP